MEQNLLEGLKGLKGEVKSSTVSSYLGIQFNGRVKIERGNFSMNIYFYATVHETNHKGVIKIDDWDVNESDEHTFNGLPIDNISSFKTKLTEWGLGSIGNKLSFSNDEEKTAICLSMLENEELKKLYGKKFKVWELLSADEQKLLELQLVVETYENVGNSMKERVAQFYKMRVQPTIPTLDEFKLKLAELSK